MPDDHADERQELSDVAAIVTEIEREMDIYVNVDRTKSSIAARSGLTEDGLMGAVARRAVIRWGLAVDFVRLRTTRGRT